MHIYITAVDNEATSMVKAGWQFKVKRCVSTNILLEKYKRDKTNHILVIVLVIVFNTLRLVCIEFISNLIVIRDNKHIHTITLVKKPA